MTDDSARSQHGVCQPLLSLEPNEFNDDDDDIEILSEKSDENVFCNAYDYITSDDLDEDDEEEEEEEKNEENDNNDENTGPSKRIIHLDRSIRSTKRRCRYMRGKKQSLGVYLYIMVSACDYGSLPIELFEHMVKRSPSTDLTAANFIEVMMYLPDDALSDPRLAVRYLRLALSWHNDELQIEEPCLPSGIRGGWCPDYLHTRIMRAWRSVSTHDFLTFLLPVAIDTVGKNCCDYVVGDNYKVDSFLWNRYRMFVTYVKLTLDRMSEADSLTEVEHRLTCEQFHHAMEAGATPIAVVLANFVSRATIESCAVAMRSRHEVSAPQSRPNSRRMRAMPHSSRPYCCSPLINDAVRFLLSLRCGIDEADPTTQLRTIVQTNKIPDTLVLAAMRRHYIEYGIGPREPFLIPLVREARRAMIIHVTEAYMTHMEKSDHFERIKMS